MVKEAICNERSTVITDLIIGIVLNPFVSIELINALGLTLSSMYTASINTN